jgi:undecaprenyl-diphosphatase
MAGERWGAQARGDGTLTLAEAWWIGCAQAVALVPGVSRSGATLTLALFLGLRRADAARFIFLLSIPAILGAAVKEAPALVGVGAASGMVVAIGVATSLVVSYAAVRWFIRFLGNHSLNVFAWYRFALAATVVLWVLR